MTMTDLVTTTGRHSPVVQTGRAGRIKWWLVGIVAVLLGAWELAFHTWFMSVPMVTGHRLNGLIAALLVGGVLLAAFRLLQQYEEQLATAAEGLRQKNEALSLLEAERDTRLFPLARDLALALAGVIANCEVALGLPDARAAMQAIAAAKTHAEGIQEVVRRLIALEHTSDGLLDSLPAILDAYDRERRREATTAAARAAAAPATTPSIRPAEDPATAAAP